MSDEAEFIEYMEIQGSTDLITKTELLSEMRSRGLSVGERKLTFYISKGVIPKAARIGSRTGVYPKIVAELLALALLNGQRGASIEATKQLIPLWKLVARGAISGELNLAEIELVARQHIDLLDANHAVPFMMKEILSYPGRAQREQILWTLKNGDEVRQGREDDFKVSFILGAQDDDGRAHVLAWTQLVLPGFEDPRSFDDPRTIILGIPVGVELEPFPFPREIEGATTASPVAPEREESSADR